MSEQRKLIVTGDDDWPFDEELQALEPGGQSNNTEKMPVRWSSTKGIPLDAIRSALFTIVRQREAKAFLEDVPIYTRADSNVTMRYTGPLLGQYDAAVWQQAITMGREQPMIGEWISFSARRFLDEIGIGSGSRENTRMVGAFKRLTAAMLTAEHRKYSVHGLRLISKFREPHDKDDDGNVVGAYAFKLDPDLDMLMRRNASIDLHGRALLDSSLAQWLYAYYSTHRATMYIPLDELMALTGYRVGPKQTPASGKAEFKRQVSDALKEIRETLQDDAPFSDASIDAKGRLVVTAKGIAKIDMGLSRKTSGRGGVAL